MKKLIVFLAAHLIWKKGQQVEMESAAADELIAAGKAIEATPDTSQKQRDHATNPSADPAEVMAQALAKAMEPTNSALKALGERVGELETKRTKGTSNMDGVKDAEETRPVITGLNVKKASEGTGISFVRIAKAVAMVNLAARDGRTLTVEQQLERWGYKDELKAYQDRVKQFEYQRKAFGASVLVDGGSLVPEQFAAEIIALLRNATAIRRLGYRQMDLSGGNLTIGRQTSAATAAYFAEGAVISTSKPGTDQVRLSAKKLGAVTPVSNDLIRQASVSAEEFVRADLIAVMAIREDLAFLRGDGTVDTPRGLRTEVAAANIYAATAVAPKVPTLQEVRTELAKAKYFLRKNNVDVTAEQLAWVFNPRTRYFLELLQDGNGNNAIFATELAQGRLWGIPFVDTMQVPDNLGGGDESEIYLYRKDEFMIGDHMQMEITVDPNGTYEEGGVAKSGFSRDETPIRVISAHDSRLRHNISGVVVTTVRWGAP
jgi:HK97 family phage major capsid protein